MKAKKNQSLSNWEKYIEAVTGLLLILGILVVLVNWNITPNTLALKYNSDGQATWICGKWIIIFLVGLNIIIYGGLTLLGRSPNRFFYIVTINKENLKRQYEWAEKFLRYFKLELVSLLVYIEVITMFQNRRSIGSILVLLLIILATIVKYIRKSIALK